MKPRIERLAEEEVCTCDRDTIAENMARPGCPVHAPLSKSVLWPRDHPNDAYGFGVQ